MIRVALLDDHPAVLAGLHRLVKGDPNLSLIAAVEREEALWRQLDGFRADVVVTDYDLARGNGLVLCQRLKERPQALAVVIYSAYAGPALALASRIAGADAVVDKGAPVEELLATIRTVNDRPIDMPEIPDELRQAAIARLHDDDVAVAAMLLAGTSHQGIAEALRIDRRDVRRRARRIVTRVSPNGSPRVDADRHRSARHVA